MNRREMFKRVTGGMVAAGIGEGVTIHAIDAPVDSKSTLVVLRLPGMVSMDTAARIKAYWEHVTEGTNWEGVKLVVLEDGATLEVHQRVEEGRPS